MPTKSGHWTRRCSLSAADDSDIKPRYMTEETECQRRVRGVGMQAITEGCAWISKEYRQKCALIIAQHGTDLQ